MLSFHYISQITGGDNNINANVGRWEATARARQSCCVIFSLHSSWLGVSNNNSERRSH